MLQPQAAAPESATDIQPTEGPVAALTATVARRIREAKAAREASGIEQIWQEDADQYDGIDPAEGDRNSQSISDTAAKAPSQRSRVVLNITKPKTDAGLARVQEMLLPTDDKPWEIKPTPIPELMEALETGAAQTLTLGDGTQASADQVAQVALRRADAAAKKAATWIEDQFAEGRVYAELRKVIRNAARIGTGVIKGPFPVMRESRRWSVAEGVAMLVIENKDAPTSKCIDARDLFPDPACGENLHNGSYVVERDYATARQLKKLAKDPLYDSAAIAAALREGPPSRARDSSRRRDQAGEVVSESDVYELWHYYGEAEPDTLVAMGAARESMNPDDLYLASVPAIITMLNDRPIKAVLNPLESGEFPFDVFPWESVDGQIWGRGIPRKMRVAQRMLTAATRALLENAGLSAGPQIAITDGALEPMNGRYEIVGRKLWKFKPSEFVSDIRSAMQVWSIDSAQEELSNIIAFALQMADDLTNLPMIMQGQSNREGGASTETVGGMTMAMNSANAPLRVIAKQFDDCIIARHLKAYYDWCMQSGPEDAKGDMQIVARGSTALVQREIAREFLMQLYPVAKDEALRIDPAKLGAEMAKANGFNLASVQYTEPEWAALQQQRAQNPLPQDPRVAAAQIRAQAESDKVQASIESDAQRREFEAREADLDRRLKAALADVEREIEMMRLAGDENISLAEIKAMLASKTIDSRDRRTEMQLKLSDANPTNEGI